MFRPAGCLGTASCQRSLPLASSKHIKTPRSPWYLGSRGESLLVPTNTRPPATVGLPYDCDPSFTTHFRDLDGSGESWSASGSSPALACTGNPFSCDTMLREPSRPQLGQSAA